METFAATFAVALAIPICLLALGGIRIYVFARTSLNAVGKVSAVHLQDWIDDESMPVTRYFASVQYVVGSEAYTIPAWGPHDKAPAIGATVAVRYKAVAPDVARVWSGPSWRWLLVPLAVCVAAEILALKIWLG